MDSKMNHAEQIENFIERNRLNGTIDGIPMRMWDAGFCGEQSAERSVVMNEIQCIASDYFEDGANAIAPLLLMAMDELQSATNRLNNIKYDLESRVYTLSEDEFGTIFFCRDMIDKAITEIEKALGVK